MSTREAFGLNLRRARQHRGVSLTDISAHTNVSVELWEDMERNDFTRWPGGVYARTWIRAYAELIGADPVETVNDFCRWFPQGDRRAEPVLRRQAEVVGHQLDWHDAVPAGGNRRAPDPPPPQEVARRQVRPIRLVAAGCDLCAVLLTATATTFVVKTSLLSTLGIVASLYYTVSLASLGSAPAVWTIDRLMQTRPELVRRGASLAFRRL